MPYPAVLLFLPQEAEANPTKQGAGTSPKRVTLTHVPRHTAASNFATSVVLFGLPALPSDSHSHQPDAITYQPLGHQVRGGDVIAAVLA